jgi:hypothetical protein
MDHRFGMTHAALAAFDDVDRPALDAMRRDERTARDLAAFTDAHRRAADRVRAAYLEDTRHFNTPENVELMSIERIREGIGGTPLGKLLGLLP